jgi:hypothetical protein
MNPTGTITKSDLELTAVICGATLAAQHTPAHSHQYSLLAMDNTPALTWLSKSSTNTNKAPAYLLQLLARLRREHDFRIALGTSNALADCCSRLFHLDDGMFLNYMNVNFPIQPSWTLVTPATSLT